METDRYNALLPHLERALGRFTGDGVAEPEWNVPFSAFRWRDSPEPGVNTLVSFGLGRHLFDRRRQELLLALRPTWDGVALDIIVSVGTYLLDRHVPFDVGESIAIPPELKTAPRTLRVASADELTAGLGTCSDYEPPVEVLWLVPHGSDGRFDLGPAPNGR